MKRISKDRPVMPALLKDVAAQDKANNAARENVSVGEKPLDPPALYEDSGEGYNRDFTIPQE